MVLRGPQGVLFGRNVTGGAVLVRTRAPSNTFEASGHASFESGIRATADSFISGPIVPGLLSGKLALYYSHDNGWFTNRFNGESLGRERTTVARPAFRFTLNDALDVTVRAEHGQVNGDGPVARNPNIVPPGFQFYVMLDQPGYSRSKCTATVRHRINTDFL